MQELLEVAIVLLFNLMHVVIRALISMRKTQLMDVWYTAYLNSSAKHLQHAKSIKVQIA